MKKRNLLALMLALALMLLTACGSDKVEAPAATAAPVVTEAPTAEPTEAPTAEPTEAPTAEPTEVPAAEETEETEVIGGADAETEIVVASETAEIATAAEAAAEEDPVVVTAYDGAVQIRLSEVQEEFEAALTYYIDYYSQYGYTIDEYDTEFQQAVADEAAYVLMSEAIVKHYAAQNGYELTAEKEEELAAQVQATVDSAREYYQTYLSYYGYSGDELNAIVEEELAAMGYDYESLMDSMKLNDVLEFLLALANVDTTITEEEVKAAYDAKVAEAMTTYADVDAYVEAYFNGEDILYTPEGMRRVQSIFVVADSETATPAEATAAEATAAEATAAQAQDISALTGVAKAEAVLAKIRGGESFQDMMFAYNEDGATEEEMLEGYPISEACTVYGDEFYTGAMALENVGDVSDVIVTSYGCYILHYAEDMTAGAADFEARKDAETEEALANKKQEVFSAYLNTVMDEAGYEVGDMSALFHVYEAVVVEPTISYATVSAETALTDMPAGDTVATLAAGASLDILGRIGMDGEEYAFVSIPGTAYKGYVNAAVMTVVEEETALAVDNTALVSAGEALDKKPTFTIVMNDGSVIYGELYPEIAPESVGNFVDLANSGFYNGLIFHRVIAGFMIQGGDPLGSGMGGPGYAIKGEFANNGVTNDLSHTRGVLSMARSSAMDSAGSQFFIMHADSDYLDGDYAAFGMVLGGIETVDVIASTPTDSSDKPMNEQAMREVYVETYGKTYAFTKLED